MSIDDINEQVEFEDISEYEDQVIAYYGEDSSFYIVD